MSSKWLRIRKYFLLSIAIIFILSALSLLLLSTVYIPRKINGYIENISDEKGYEIKIDDLNFGFISGLKINEIMFYVEQGSKKPIIKVQRLIIKPDIFSSLFNRRLIVKELIIDKPRVSLTENGFNEIKKLKDQTKEEDRQEKEDDKSLVEISLIEVNEAQIEVAVGKSINIDKLLLKIDDSNLHDRLVLNLGGSIALYNNDADFHGIIKSSSDVTSGELFINLDELKIDDSPKAFHVPKKLSVDSEIKFEFGKEIDLRGVVDVISHKKDASSSSEIFAKLDYRLLYDKLSGSLSIDSLNLNIGKLLSSSFGGSIEKLATDGVLKIRGSARVTDLRRITTLFPGISNYQWSGNIEANDIELKGSWKSNNISLDGTLNLSGVNVKSEDNSFQIVELKSDLNFKSFFSGNRFGGFSVEGDFGSNKLLTRSGEIENINGNLEFITDNALKRGSLLFSLVDLRLKFGHKDSLIISNINTTNPFKIQFSSVAKDLDDDDKRKSHKSEIIFENKGLVYKNLSFKGFVVERGEISDLVIETVGDSKWQLKLIGTGSNIHDTNGKIELEKFELEMYPDISGQSVFRGSLKITDGNYNTVKVPSIFSRYRILDDSIKLSDIEMTLEQVGELNIKTLEIINGGEGDRFSNKVGFSGGKLQSQS